MVSFSMLKLDRQFFKQLQLEEINVWNGEACKLFLSKTSRYTIEEKLQNFKNQEESDLETSLALDVEVGNPLLKKNNLHTLRLENLMWRFPFYWLLWNENNFTFHLLMSIDCYWSVNIVLQNKFRNTFMLKDTLTNSQTSCSYYKPSFHFESWFYDMLWKK